MKVTKKNDLRLSRHLKYKFLNKKTANYAKGDTQALTKMEFQNARAYALKVQQLAEKGWRNESAATIKLKSNKFSLEYYQKTGKRCSKREKQTYTCCYGTIHSISYTG